MAPMLRDQYADDSPLLHNQGLEHSAYDHHPDQLSVTRPQDNLRQSRRRGNKANNVSDPHIGPSFDEGMLQDESHSSGSDSEPSQTTRLGAAVECPRDEITPTKSLRLSYPANLPSIVTTRAPSNLDDISDSSASQSLTGGAPQSYLSHRVSIRPLSRRPDDAGRRLLRSNSLLKSLGSLNRSSLRRALSLSPRAKRYPTLHELDELKEEEVVTVDISFLEGPSSSSLTIPSTNSQVSTSSLLKNIKNDQPTPPVNAEERLKPMSTSFNQHEQTHVDGTVRQYGQWLADDKNMIVSVKESHPAVDLSTLEGSERPNTGTFDAYELKGLMTNLNHESFYYPADPEKPNWKPFSMRTPYILMLIFISLLLAGVQEYLFQRSHALEAKGGGLIRYSKVADIPAGEFFCWKYLPTMVMVCFGVLWQIMDYDVKRLEPYHQLSQPTGNTATKSINLDYVTLWAYLVPFKAIRNRHWTVAVASVGSVLATTVAPSLQNPSVALTKNLHCTDDSCPDNFKYIVRIHPVWSRLVTATLIVVALLAVILLFQLRRKSGLLSDPKGVAGVASMATKSHILNDFQGMDEASYNEIHKKLRHRRYVLYKSSIWQGEYIKHSADKDRLADDRKVENPHPNILRRTPGIAFLVFLAVCLALIPVVTYTRANVIVTKAPWLPILVAAVIKQLWTTLEFAVKMLEPFYVLSRGNARPELTLTLDYQGIPYGVLPIAALFNRHYLVALVGIGSILGDMLTVTASSLALSDETVVSFIASSTLSMAITTFLVCSGTLIWIRRRHPFLPRQPSTIASILAFIHQSRMLDDFVGTERYSNDKMRAMLVARNKRYGLGWFRGRDKKPHCGVDEEPMLSQYKHGVSYIRAQAPWEENIGVL